VEGWGGKGARGGGGGGQRGGRGRKRGQGWSEPCEKASNGIMGTQNAGCPGGQGGGKAIGGLTVRKRISGSESGEGGKRGGLDKSGSGGGAKGGLSKSKKWCVRGERV